MDHRQALAQLRALQALIENQAELDRALPWLEFKLGRTQAAGYAEALRVVTTHTEALYRTAQDDEEGTGSFGQLLYRTRDRDER